METGADTERHEREVRRMIKVSGWSDDLIEIERVENGKTVWNNEKKSVSVPELKSMVEFYKEKGRDSVMGQLGDMKKTAGEKVQTQPARQKKRTEIAK